MDDIQNNNIANPPEPVPMPPVPEGVPAPGVPTTPVATAATPEAGDGPRDGDDPRSLCQTCRQNKKQMVYDWLGDAPELTDQCDYVEVQFKNTRKGYYLNKERLDLHKGDIVAVEGNPGHDIGEVTLTGYLVHLQMKKSGFRFDTPDANRKVFRLAKPGDMERYREAKAKEHDTMLRSRQIAEDLHLQMKIGDVEYQGDGGKAIFYYIADGRVDFRQLIKVLAEAFHVRIEMKQIGARQEAGRIGGIGPCGRELCCTKWMTRFQSVGTAAARYQDLSLNPQKLAGQCAKLKCCLNYEVDTYMEAHKDLPGKDIVLYTQESEWHLFKTDILARTVTYSTSKDGPFNTVTISAQRAFDVYHLNKHGQKPESLKADGDDLPAGPEFTDGAGDEDISRFDRRKRHRNRDRRDRRDRKAEPEATTDKQPAAPKVEAPQQPVPQPIAPEAAPAQPAREGDAAAAQQRNRHGRRKPQRNGRPQNGQAQPPQQAQGDPGPQPVRQPRAGDEQ